jgi:hypothetical protein
MNSLDIINRIAPFSWIKLDDGSSLVTLYANENYKKELFQTRRNEGFTGSGYDWESLARTLIQEIAPDLQETILFDSEYGMFCAYSDNTDELQRFAVLLKETCENDALIADLFARAAPDEFVADSTFLNMQEQLGNLLKRLSSDNLPSEGEIDDMKSVIDEMERDVEDALRKMSGDFKIINDCNEEDKH